MADWYAARARTWRINQFVLMGYSPQEAIEIEQLGLDVHALSDLIDAGCPPELARRIVE